MNRQRPPTMDQQRTAAKTSGGSLTCRRRNRCFCIDRPEKYCLYGILDGILLNHLYIILFVILLFGFETCSILPPNHRRRLPITTAGNRLLRLDSFLQNRKAVLPFPADPTSPAETPPPRALLPRQRSSGQRNRVRPGNTLLLRPAHPRGLPPAHHGKPCAQAGRLSPAPGRHRNQRFPPHRQGSTDIQNV